MAMWRMGSGKTTSSGRGVEAGCMNALEARRGQGAVREGRSMRPREGGLAHADNGCDAMPGGIALTLESAEVGGGDSERAVIEELADGLHRLADVRGGAWRRCGRRTCTPDRGRPAFWR